MLAAGTTTWASDIFSATTMELGANPDTDWSAYLNGSNDDSQVFLTQLAIWSLLISFRKWVILAFYKAADYLNAQGEGDLANQYLVGDFTKIASYVVVMLPLG